MVQRGLVLGLILALMLTGCGREDKLLSYIDYNDAGVVNSKEEAEALYASLDKESGLEWTYDRERIEGLMALKETLEKETEEKNFTFDEESTIRPSAVETWKSHMDQGRDPVEETARNAYFYISGGKSSEMRQLCEVVEKMGYAGASQCREERNVISRGLLFEMVEEVDEKGDTRCDLYINIPNSYVFYPVKYKDLLDVVVESGFYLEYSGVMGGALNKISFYRDTKDTLCKYIKCYLDNSGKLVGLEASMEGAGISTVRTQEERNLLVELVTRLTGDRNEAANFVNQLSSKGKSEGSIGSYNWSVNRLAMEYSVLEMN